MTTRGSPWLDSTDPLVGAIALTVGSVALVVVTGVAAVAHVGVTTVLVAQVLIMIVAAAWASPGGTLVMVALGWGLLTGFVVNDYGDLTFGAPDLEHLAVELGAGLTACALGMVARATSVRRDNEYVTALQEGGSPTRDDTGAVGHVL